MPSRPGGLLLWSVSIGIFARGHHMSRSSRASRAGVRHFAIMIVFGSVAGFAGLASAVDIPTGATGPSYTVGVTKFTQPMPRFDVLPHINLDAHQFSPLP